ncbi:hypothetical protein GCM10012290_10690 [Halolactibacillus alkaliphilus]|uniref:DUF4044 domain-containing protein n=1 Tax=Halolactibacillus alkaliphilus TaxID=442899 RepID=A0A511X2Q0_9BACI|nr:DUF4044 domain-containing protein [Halolactibacillus alkaliphilus]GEN57214.1 hypothetical protein HAL01_16780 [Halolactibacillus alkaliphilus]GGN68722.1 hypothetical protein GCM10012290_10690 [Halolactibacillus alkaliphilus]SFO72858.1 hypothetical protein SAMN05720591_1073 [Halolactibacillus alkaliphilus]
MTKQTKQHETTRKPSKRERRNKLIVYIMILTMVSSLLFTGLAYIL